MVLFRFSAGVLELLDRLPSASSSTPKVSGVALIEGCNSVGVGGLTPSDLHPPVGGENGKSFVEDVAPLVEASPKVVTTGLTAPESGLGCLISADGDVESPEENISEPGFIKLLAVLNAVCPSPSGALGPFSSAGLGTGLAFVMRNEPNFIPPICW
jgi:hypothetical protein